MGWMKASPSQRRGSLGLFFISAVTMFFVYCLFASKRTHYIAPLLPALSLAFGLLIENQQHDKGRYLPIATLIIATLNPLILLIWIIVAPFQWGLESTLREWLMVAVLIGIVSWAWMLLRAGRRSTAWIAAWVSCVIALGFFVSDPYQRAGNITLNAREFAEKVAQTVPENSCLGTLDDHAALLFHLGRSVEYLALADAKTFLENSDCYLIVHKESDLLKIDKKVRSKIVFKSPYRHRRTAYLLRGSE